MGRVVLRWHNLWRRRHSAVCLSSTMPSYLTYGCRHGGGELVGQPVRVPVGVVHGLLPRDDGKVAMMLSSSTSARVLLKFFSFCMQSMFASLSFVLKRDSSSPLCTIRNCQWRHHVICFHRSPPSNSCCWPRHPSHAAPPAPFSSRPDPTSRPQWPGTRWPVNNYINLLDPAETGLELRKILNRKAKCLTRPSRVSALVWTLRSEILLLVSVSGRLGGWSCVYPRWDAPPTRLGSSGLRSPPHSLLLQCASSVPHRPSL